MGCPKLSIEHYFRITGPNHVPSPSASRPDYNYDADGNLLSDGIWSYTWDAENRRTKMERTGKAKLEFAYDYIGRRISKKSYTWNGSDWAVSGNLKFIYDGWNLISEIDAASNAIVRTYLWGEDISGSMQGAGGVGGLLAVKEAYTSPASTAMETSWLMWMPLAILWLRMSMTPSAG